MKPFLGAACIIAIGYAATATAQPAALQVGVHVPSGASIETDEGDFASSLGIISIGTLAWRPLPPVLIKMTLKTGPTGNMSLGVLPTGPSATIIASPVSSMVDALPVRCDQKIVNQAYVPGTADASSVSNCVAWGPHTSAAVQVRLTLFYSGNGGIPTNFGSGTDAFNIVVSQT